MAYFPSIKKALSSFTKDKSGNIAIFTAFALLPLMISVGAAIDYSRVVQIRGKLTQSADAALLSAASSVMKSGLVSGEGTISASDEMIINAQLNEVFDKFFKANFGSNAAGISYNIVFDPETKDVKVELDFTYTTAFSGFITPDVNLATISAINMKASGQGALTMMLVLDKSGSMGWQNRMNILKIAVLDMSTQFEEKDPNHEFVRLGAVAYDSSQKPSSNIAWGTVAANGYVQALLPGGGTNSSTAMQTAYQDVSNAQEVDEHEEMNQQVPKKYIVFLTDGNNNKSQYDTQTLNACDQAKNSAIEIFTVAFQAPAQGQQLLQNCASSTNHYFQATNAQDLINAFKYIGAAAVKGLKITQ